jgi:hypothetical protein
MENLVMRNKVTNSIGPTDVNGPRKRIINDASGDQLIFQEGERQLSFDSEAFQNFIKGQGIWITHYRALPDPRGMASRGDNRDVLDLRPQDSDGFVYKKAGDIQATFTVNSKNISQDPLGEISNSVAYMTMPKYYSDNPKEEVLIHPWDRFYLKDIEIRVVNLQFLESRKEGVDKLQYPAVRVEELVDSNGVWYTQDTDFAITEEGNIKWLGQKRPGWNVNTGKGTVFSIRYRYTPYFIVVRLIHEIRVSQITDPATFKRTLERMPYQVEVIREIVFRDANTNPGSPTIDIRYQNAPQVGGNLGPIGAPKIGGPTGPKGK